MNNRKKVDYSEMYLALDTAMTANLPQMELYCTIGKAVSQRSEKGAAVAAAEYLTEHYPDAHGFSPRNVRRMRDFYNAYEDSLEGMKAAMEVGWTQNVVIIEADLTMELRAWYLKAAKQFGWSKAELIEKIAANACEEIVLAIDESVCYSEVKESRKATSENGMTCDRKIRNLIRSFKIRWITKEKGWRRWLIMLCRISTAKPTAFMRC